jgi:integrase
MALGKQAKTLTQKQIEVALSYLATTRHGLRNQVVFLLSTKAGLRAKEIAGLRWTMVVDATGQVGITPAYPVPTPARTQALVYAFRPSGSDITICLLIGAMPNRLPRRVNGWSILKLRKVGHP